MGRKVPIIAGLLLASTAPAQEAPASRSGVFAALQAKKSGELKPPHTDKAEEIVRRLESVFVNSPSGFYPQFGSVYHGGGVTLGAGYRKFYGDNTSWNVNGLYSFKNYKLIEAGTESSDHFAKRLSFGAKLGWRDATQVGYYGLGTQTNKENRTNFRFQQTYADGHAVFRPVWWFPIQGSVGAEHWETLQGKGNNPSIETTHSPETAPGLGANPSFLHSTLAVGIDWRRPSPGYTRRGGLYQATLHDYRSNESGTYSFQRLDGDLIQHIPILRETWVLALRGRWVTTLNDNDVIPYFLLPALGDGSSLRAFDTDRFRDRHSMLMTGEFRWIPSTAVDMAFFYDAGKVTSRRRDLNFKALKSDVGVGIRFHGLLVTPLRIDLAVGNEGWKLVFGGDAVF